MGTGSTGPEFRTVEFERYAGDSVRCTHRVRPAIHVTMFIEESAQVSSNIVGSTAITTGTPEGPGEVHLRRDLRPPAE
jgi:hypothetical protein